MVHITVEVPELGKVYEADLADSTATYLYENITEADEGNLALTITRFLWCAAHYDSDNQGEPIILPDDWEPITMGGYDPNYPELSKAIGATPIA